MIGSDALQKQGPGGFTNGLERGRRQRAAVALIGAVFAGAIFAGNPLLSSSNPPFVYEADRLVAAGALEEVLYDPTKGGREEGPTIISTFEGERGAQCRSFVDGRVKGVACQSGGDWRIIEIRQN